MNDSPPVRTKVRHVPHVSLRALREAQGYSQEQMGIRVGKLAGRAPLHFSTIGKIERGEREISARLLRPLAQAYGVNPNDITWVGITTPVEEADETEDEDKAA